MHNDRLALLLVIVSSPFSTTASLRIRARSSLSPFHPLLKFLFQEQVGESGTESRPAAVLDRN